MVGRPLRSTIVISMQPSVPSMQHSNVPPERSWWSRYWIAVAGCGCLTVVLFALAFVAAIWFGVTRLIVSSDSVKHAIQIAERDPSVTALLGTPLHTGWLIRGTIHIENDSGTIDATIPLVGPRGSGDLRIVADREHGVWRYRTLELQSGNHFIDFLKGSSRGIDL
ncbi:MAG: cytochrome c oxidase assembly factor Coa1 family protein [Acidobacteriota bacterium]